MSNNLIDRSYVFTKFTTSYFTIIFIRCDYFLTHVFEPHGRSYSVPDFPQGWANLTRVLPHGRQYVSFLFNPRKGQNQLAFLPRNGLYNLCTIVIICYVFTLDHSLWC
jgi:hypothetical protein